MKHHHLTLLVVILTLTGCENESDERLSRLVQETTAAQASQNRAVTELNREAAASHKAVVEAVEESRQELVSLERDLQRQRDRIDDERRGLANERYRESLLGPVLGSVRAMLVAALPLVLCWYLLHGLRSQHDDVVSQVLIEELIPGEPRLLAPQDRPQALRHQDEVQSPEEEDKPPF